MTYSQMVPVMVGSKITDRALSVITKGELEKMTTTWRQAHFGAVMSGLLQLSHMTSSKMGKEEEVSHPSPGSDPVEVWKFSLYDIKGPVHTTQKVTIPPFSTVSVHANTSVKRHCMWVHVLTELMLVLYNILLLINCYIGNSTTMHHSGSMSNNRELTETFHQNISSYYKVIASAF